MPRVHRGWRGKIRRAEWRGRSQPACEGRCSSGRLRKKRALDAGVELGETLTLNPTIQTHSRSLQDSQRKTSNVQPVLLIISSPTNHRSVGQRSLHFPLKCECQTGPIRDAKSTALCPSRGIMTPPPSRAVSYFVTNRPSLQCHSNRLLC